MAALTCDEVRARLADVETALHRFAIGGQVRTVRDGDRQVDFAAQGDALLRAKARYTRLLAACDGTAVPCGGRAIRVTPV